MTVAIAWLLQRSPNILLIPGTSSRAHLYENVAGASLTLSSDDVAQLDAIASTVPRPDALGSSGRLRVVRVTVEVLEQARVRGRPRHQFTRLEFDAGLSSARNEASHVKCAAASSGAIDTTGTSRWRPMTWAISRRATPSSAVACNVAPAGALSSASRKRRAASSRWMAANDSFRRRCSPRRPWPERSRPRSP